MVSAIIVAAGKGIRMNSGTRKQYIAVAGRPILGHTLHKFDACDRIDIIYLLVPEADFDHCRKSVLSTINPNKPIRLVAGGAERQDSVYNGLLALEEKSGLVVIHDGVRPLIQPDLIASCIQGAMKTGACIAGIPAFDTIKQADDTGTIEKTLSREGLWLAQTPQVFRYDLIREAHDRALREDFHGTDDAILVERLGHFVTIINGSKTNIKITTEEDLVVAETLLEEESA